MRAALGEGIAGSFHQQSRVGISREGMDMDCKREIFQVFPCFCCLAHVCLDAQISKVTKIETYRIFPLLSNYKYYYCNTLKTAILSLYDDQFDQYHTKTFVLFTKRNDPINT